MMYITILDCFVEVIFVYKEQLRTVDRYPMRDFIILIYAFFEEKLVTDVCHCHLLIYTFTIGVQFLSCHSDSIY